MNKYCILLFLITISNHAAVLIPPKLISKSALTYTPSMKASGLEGKVILTLLVNEIGAVESVTVSTSIHPLLDSLAINSAKKLRFTPATMEGTPVATTLPFLVTFSLKHDLERLTSEVRISGTLTRKGSTETLANQIIRYMPADSILFGLPKNLVLDQLGTFYHQSQENNSIITKTDSLGRFAFRGVPDGKFTIQVETDAYKSLVIEDTLNETKLILPLTVEPLEYNPYEVISTYRSSNHTSSYTINADHISHTAGTSGDPLRGIQTLPSVARTVRNSQPVIRGARPEDSKFYFDGIELPYLFHNGGFKSVLPGKILATIELCPSGYGAYYGNSIGGVIIAQSDTLSPKKLNGNFDINTLDMGGFVDANLVKELRLSLGGRISERFGIMKQYAKSFEGDNGLIPKYSDYFGKLQYFLLDRNHLDIDFIGSQDSLTTVVQHRWDPKEHKKFNRISFGWVRERQKNYSHQFNFGYGLSRTESNSTQLNVQGQRNEQVVKQNFLATKFNWFLPHSISISNGFTFSSNQERARTQTYNCASKNVEESGVESGFHIFSPWMELGLHPSSTWEFKLGGRYDYSSRADISGTRYPSFSPRVEKKKDHSGDPSIRAAAWYQVNAKQRIKFGFGTYNQLPKQTIQEDDSLYREHSIPTTKSTHHTIGYELQIVEKLGIDVQAYYNRRWNLPFRTDPNVPKSQVYTGEGESKGIEILLRQARIEHFEGWLSYSLSQSKEKTTGDFIVTNTDQTQNIQALGTFYLPKKWEIGSRVLYTTGNPYTPIDSIYPQKTENGSTYYVEVSGNPNSERLDPAIQLHLRVSKTITAKRSSTEMYLDLGNILYPIYKVPEYQTFNQTTGLRENYYQPPIPTFGVKVTF